MKEARHYSSLVECSEAVAAYIANLATSEITQKNSFNFVLTGGKTPRILYELLAQPSFCDQKIWQKTNLFWSDERCVSPNHPDSNYAMAHETLLSNTNIPSENIYRIPAELSPPRLGAETYEATLQKFFNNTNQLTSFPSFDLILLGMGQDGHIASLFPGSSALFEENHWVTAVEQTGAPPVARITLTFPVINHAKCVLFLISGGEKQKIAQAIIDAPQTISDKYPAAKVKTVEKLLWYIADE